MLRSVSSRFYAIAGVLILIFGIGYSNLAYFLGKQSQNTITMQETVLTEREIRYLHNLFYQIRFWERKIFFQEHPAADKQFGAIMVQMRKRLMTLHSKQLSIDIKGKVEQVLSSLAQYERNFNKIIQLKTDQRLLHTRMDTKYRSLASYVLRSNKNVLLKPLFNLTHFLISYRIDRLESEYQALKVVTASLENRLLRTKLMDDRAKEYLSSFRNLLENDFTLESEIRSLNLRFEKNSAQLMTLLRKTSQKAERVLREKFEEVEKSRAKLNRFFLISSVAGIIMLLLILTLISRKIINPIKSVAGVMREVKAGNIKKRSEVFGNENDEIVQFGLSFNDMLDTLEKNNKQLVDYQRELEERVSELAIREKELEEHRNHLEEIVKDRTSELTNAVQQLREEISQRQNVERELKKHREDLETIIKERTADLSKTNQELETEMAGRKKAERERQRLTIQLQRAEKMEAIGTLAGGVAHDLNNILSGIVSYPELLLLQLPEDSQLREPIITIRESGEKAATVVQDLLTLARRGVAVTNVVNLNHTISDYLKSPEHMRLKSLYTEAQVEINLETNLLNIIGSSIHLLKTVMNLVTNATESMPEGGKTLIKTENRYIDKPIRGYDDVEEGDYAVLSISDTGVGISAKDLSRIFEPFYTKKVMGRSGTGLGMAVVWGTVKDHNGYIDVQSDVGKGTIFTLYFPATREKLASDQSQLVIEDYMGKENSILIVDDIKEQREIASGMLNQLGYLVTSVSSGEDAIKYLQSNSADLVILDMIMDPGIDGLETYRHILELHPGQRAIIVSGFSETERVKEAQKLGAGDYIKKPYTLEQLGLAVKKELEKM